MLFMILLGLALTPPSFGASPVAAATARQGTAVVPPFATDGPREDCPNPAARMAEENGRGARARRLDELPPGRLEYAVFREVDGCAIPAVVHENIGGRPDREGEDRR